MTQTTTTEKAGTTNDDTHWALVLNQVRKTTKLKKGDEDATTQWAYTLEAPIGDVKVVVTVDQKLPWAPESVLEVRVRAPYEQATLPEDGEA